MNNKEIIKKWSNERSKYNEHIKLLPLQLVVLNKIDKNDVVFIFDEVGVGKTIEAAWCIWKTICSRESSRILIITKNSIKSQFEDVIKKFIGQENFQRHITIINDDYRNIEKISKCNHYFDLIILDEAHLFKDDTSARSKRCKNLRSNKLIVMTATPIKNNLNELKSLIELSKIILNKNLNINIPKAEDFLNFDENSMWMRNFKCYINLLGSKNINLAKRRFPTIERYIYSDNIMENLLENDECDLYHHSGNIFLKIKKHIDLITNKLIRKEPTKNNESEINELKNKSEKLKKIIEIYNNVLEMKDNSELINKVKDIDGKIRCLDDYINKIMFSSNIKNRIVIFVKRKDTGKYLNNFLKLKYKKLFKITYINGNTENRDEIINEEKNGESSDIFIITEEIGKEGLNLKEFNYVINYELPTSPADLEQRFGRIDRLGTDYEYINNTYLLHEVNHKNLNTYFLDNDVFNINLDKFWPTILTPIPSKNIIFSKDELTYYFKNIKRKRKIKEEIQEIISKDEYKNILNLFNEEILNILNNNKDISIYKMLEQSKVKESLDCRLDYDFKIEKDNINIKFDNLCTENIFKDEELRRKLNELRLISIECINSKYKDIKNAINQYLRKVVEYLDNEEITISASDQIDKMLNSDIKDLIKKDKLDIKNIENIENNIFYIKDGVLQIIDPNKILENLKEDVKKSNISKILEEIREEELINI